MRIIKYVLSGEFLFAAFLLANIFKSALPFIPIDLNIILFILTVGIAMKKLYLKRSITKLVILPISLFAIFIGYTLFSHLYSPSQVYASQKVLYLFTLSAWCFVAPFILINNIESLKRFLSSFLIITVLTSAYGLLLFNPNGSAIERFGVAGANSIGLGRAAALSIIILVLMYIFNNGVSKTKKVFSILAFIILLIVLFLTGARMALISLIVALLIYILMKTFIIKNREIHISKKSIKVSSLLLLTPLLIFPFWESMKFMVERLINLFDSSGFGSYTQRTELYTIALNMWTDNLPNFLIGNGIGSYTIFFDGIDERYYPHNIFLEIASELGVIGLLIFLILIVTPFIIHNQFKANYIQVIVMLMFLYAFMNANTTGDINDNRMIFTFLALMYMYPLFKNDTK